MGKQLKYYDLALIEDDPIMGESLCMRFEMEQLHYCWLKSFSEAKAALKTKKFGVILSDMRLPDGSGETLLNQCMEQEWQTADWFIFTGYSSVEESVRLMKMGVVDYLAKPFDIDILIQQLKNALPKKEIKIPNSYTLGKSKTIKQVEKVLVKMARYPFANVLILGETGHVLTYPENQAPFEAINCSALSENLLESELFGHEKGAFTGAGRIHKGVFERAHNGTLLLDEIGDMPLSMQAKLLRVLQERRFTRVGGERTIPFDGRIIAATHKDLQALVNQGLFREDLLYRINTVTITLPPLRDRPDDILNIALNILKDIPSEDGLPFQFSPPAQIALLSYKWPGNIRELKNIIERAAMLCESHIFGLDDLSMGEQLSQVSFEGVPLKRYVQECEKSYILSVLEKNNWKMIHSAQCLGISRKSLWEKIQKLGIEPLESVSTN